MLNKQTKGAWVGVRNACVDKKTDVKWSYIFATCDDTRSVKHRFKIRLSSISTKPVLVYLLVEKKHL